MAVLVAPLYRLEYREEGGGDLHEPRMEIVGHAMTRVVRSAAMPETIDASARRHLLRGDGQEDLCFALWHPSTGKTRVSALVERLILPGEGERNVHGNASFESHYFTRVLSEAAQAGAGVALMHSHPGGRAWQNM